MGVTEKVSNDCKSGSQNLTRYVPPALDYTKDHSSGKDDAPCRDLNDDVNPENAVLIKRVSSRHVWISCIVVHTSGSAEMALPSSM